MGELHIGSGEAKFAEIIWEREPISSTELAKVSEERLGWKKSTSFTVLKRLIEKGIFQNDHGTVSSLMTKEKYYSLQGEHFISDTFGTLPAFIAAFNRHKPLSEKEISEIKKLIDDYERKGK